MQVTSHPRSCPSLKRHNTSYLNVSPTGTVLSIVFECQFNTDLAHTQISSVQMSHEPQQLCSSLRTCLPRLFTSHTILHIQFIVGIVVTNHRSDATSGCTIASQYVAIARSYKNKLLHFELVHFWQISKIRKQFTTI
jgi:hypothetical protein